MKQRRVMVTLELDTAVDLIVLKSARWWNAAINGNVVRSTQVLQAQANVIRKARRKVAKRKRQKSKRRPC